MSGLFVEEVENPAVAHAMLSIAKLISVARDYTVIYSTMTKSESFTSSDVLERYFENFEIIDEQKYSPLNYIKIALHSIFLYIFHFKRESILEIEYRGIKLGPVIYDSYLARYRRPTVQILDIRILKLIFGLIRDIENKIKALKSKEISTILVSHRVGSRGASYVAAANILNVDVFSYGGDNRVALIRSNELTAYEYAPSSVDIEFLRSLSPKRVTDNFEVAAKLHLGHQIIRDSSYAFSGKIWNSRDAFRSHFGMHDSSLPMVFILAHVFTDYPNSISRNSAFSDYYQWLKGTLDLAARNPRIQWVVREHPSSRFYGIDVDVLSRLRKRYLSSNVVWLSAEDDFSSESIQFIADAVITYVGSAGYEYPALYEVPSIYWSHAPYSKFQIGTEISSLNEYQKILSDLHTRLGSLHLNVHEARLHYIFTNWMARVPFEVNPAMTQGEFIQSAQNPIKYINDAISYCKDNAQKLTKQEKLIVKQLQLPSFGGLRNDLLP